MARLVVVEGADQVGKETQSKLLEKALGGRGLRCTRVEVPTKACPRTHRLIYRMLRNGWAKRFTHTFQFVQFLNKLFFQLFHLPALLRANEVVILDRWSLSAIIHGGATGVNATFNRLLCGLLRRPDVTVVFHGSSFRRSTTTDDAYERDSELQARVKQDYYDWAWARPSDHALVTNLGKSVDEVHRDVIRELEVRRIIPGPCPVCHAPPTEPCDPRVHR